MLLIQFPYTIEKNAIDTIPIYGNCMTGIFFDGDTIHFSSKIENLAQNFFVFFFNRKSNFVRKQTFFGKNFRTQNLILCVHNVVLDTIKLAFIFFSINKIPLYGVLKYALINV